MKKLRILLLEDNPKDAELEIEMLQSEGMNVDIVRVDTRSAFETAITKGTFDIILSDYSLPGYDGLAALSFARQAGRQIPFIFVTGAMGEDIAVESLKKGATDYVLKHGLHRLAPSVKRALEEAHERQERRRAQQALAESEWHFHTLAQMSPVGIFRANADGTLTYFNQRGCAICGMISGNPAASENWSQLVHAEDRNRVLAAWETMLKEGCCFKSEHRFIHADGQVVWVLAEAVPEVSPSGEILGFVGTLTDITDLKRAEERIREQAELLDKASDAICVIDLDRRIRYWNKGAERLYGWKAGEVTGKIAGLYVWREGNALRFEEVLQQVLAQKEWSGELHDESRDGRKLVVYSRWTLVHDVNGWPRSILMIKSDITEQKKLEEKFLRAQRMECVGALAGGVAHDLNNALAPIVIGAQSIRDVVTDDWGRQCLDIIELSAQRGADMVRQILSFTKGMTGEHADVQIRHLLKDMQKIAKETFPRNIVIRASSPEDLRTVHGDATQVHQILMNLCVNARDAMPAGGVLQMTAENSFVDDATAEKHPGIKSGPHVALTVSDTGTGIPPEILERIFEPFFSTKETRGTGLGLSTVMGIVKSHGGFIEVESQPGKGSAFKIFLPAKTAAGAGKAAGKPVLSQGKGELVLVVDDEAVICEMARMVLDQYGYRVLAASNGLEALALARERAGEVDVAVVDMIMPIMGGRDTVRALRELDPGIRIIAASGLDSSAKETKLDESEDVLFLQKPYSTETFVHAVQKALSGSRAGMKPQHAICFTGLPQSGASATLHP